MIERWFNVRCDGCGETTEPNDEDYQPIREVLKYLVGFGWKHERATAITAARDLCPGCNPTNQPTKPKPVDPRQQPLF